MNDSEDLTMVDLLKRQAKKHSEKTVITSVQGGSITYGELDQSTNRVAHAVAEMGIGHQETVLTMMPDSIESIQIWCGLAKRGAIDVPVNLAYRGRVLAHICNDSLAKTIIVDRQYLDRLEDISDDLEHLERCIIHSEDPAERGNLELPEKLSARLTAEPFERIFSQDPSPFLADLGISDVALILYTSGTTGPSKGVMITHGHALTEAIVDASEVFGLASDDVFYTAGLPLFHISRIGIVLASVHAGASVVLRNGYKNQNFWPDIEKHGCTITMAMGAVGNWLLQQPESPDDSNTPLRKIGMYPVPAEHETFSRRFGVKIGTAYSQTECPAPLASPMGAPLPSARYVGKPRKGVEVKILDSNDQEVPVGEMGELCVRPEQSWQILLGYWQRPEATAKSFRNLWYHTGDAVYRDSENRFYFVDRITDSIRRRGENISTMEVEDDVNSHPQVLECCAFPVQADESEKEVMVTITPKPGETIDPEELLRYLNERMPYFMVPRYIDFADELARTPTGKIQKFPLREKGITETTWDRVAAGVKLQK